MQFYTLHFRNKMYNNNINFNKNSLTFEEVILMKNFKKLMSTLLGATLLIGMLGGCGSSQSRLDQVKEAGVLTMATSPDFAPMEFEDISSGETKYVGSDIELGKYIAEQLGVELEIQAMDFSAVQAAVTSGQADIAISGFAKTEDRAESMELSNFYGMEESDGKGQGLLVLADQVDNYTSAEDFSGKLIGAQNGSLQYNLVTSQLPDAEIELVSSLNDGLLMLQTGKIDALAVSGDNGEMFEQNYDSVSMSSFYFDYQSEGNVVAAKKGETELMEAINEIIADVNEQGLYLQWKEEATELAKSLGIEVDE